MKLGLNRLPKTSLQLWATFNTYARGVRGPRQPALWTVYPFIRPALEELDLSLHEPSKNEAPE